uniref:Paired domain-containing protein n=1 Tax=Plectus sambesii TaxID=2011161 RepID=A0A914X5U0_9BILA
MNDFGMQHCEDIDMDFEAWLNDTANLIQSYNCNQTYSTLQMSIQEEEVLLLSDEINKSPNSDTDRNDLSEQAVCNKDNPKRRKNHFGREYVCGRPLPLDVRLAIRDMFQAGGNACEIAVKLNITHGCASKILKRYKATGSVEAKKIGGSNPKKTVPAVVEAIIKHKTNEPQLKTWELRDRLIADAVCDTSSIPTIPSINRSVV